MSTTGRIGEGETPSQDSLPTALPTVIGAEGATNTSTESNTTTRIDTVAVSKQDILNTLDHFKTRPAVNERDPRIPLLNKNS